MVRLEEGHQATEAAEQRRRHWQVWLGVAALGFLFIAIVGFGNIGAADGRLSIWSILFLVGMMAVYIYTAYGNEHVSADTKGDGTYYLGLLFTVFALLVALIRVARVLTSGDPAATGIVIENFGYALITTVVGLAGRVWFTMGQESPGDLALTATRAFDDAVEQMRSSVVRGGQAMEDLLGHLHESAEGLEQTTAAIGGTAENAARTAKSLEEYSTKVAETAAEFSSGIVSMNAQAKQTRDSLEALDQSISASTASVATFGNNADETERQLAVLGSRLHALDQSAENAAAEIRSSGATFVSQLSELEPVAKKLTDLAGRAEAAGQALAASSAALSDYMDGFDGASNRARDAAADFARRTRDAGNSLEDKVSEAADTVSQRMEAVESTVNAIRGSLQALERAAAESAGRIDRLGETIEGASGRAAESGAQLVGLGDAGREAETHLVASGKEVAAVLASLSPLAESLSALVDRTDAAGQAVASATENLSQSMAALDKVALGMVGGTVDRGGQASRRWTKPLRWIKARFSRQHR